MIRVVCWNIDKRAQPWRVLAEMAQREEADIALLQEAGNPPDELGHLVQHDDERWNQDLYDRWPMVVRLSDRVEVNWLRQVAPRSELDEGEIGVSGIGTLAAARVWPRDRPEDAFLAVSMYARWIQFHPLTGHQKSVGASDVSAHRILSDLSTFIYDDGSHAVHRILAAGDLNISYGATRRTLSIPQRERTLFDRFAALGLEFLGPQAPNGRPAPTPQPDVPADTANVPTYYTARQRNAVKANRQLDYVIASRGFHESVTARALNGIEEWGPSDHCRLLAEVRLDR